MTREEILAFAGRYVKDYLNGELDDMQILARLHFYRKRWKEAE